jgi:hypothetical protein
MYQETHVNGSGRTLFCIRRALNVALAACLLACTGFPTFAVTGGSIIAIDQMKRGSPPAGFTRKAAVQCQQLEPTTEG